MPEVWARALYELQMNLYLLTQDENKGYDTFDSCVVAAESLEAATRIHPRGDWKSDTWASSPEKVTAVFIGVAASTIQEGEVICASFHAG